MRRGAIVLALVMLVAVAACHTSKTGAPVPPHHETGGGEQRGLASWYGSSPGQDGGPTASGETFHRDALTAAHRTLPMGTMVRVTATNTGRSVIVRINDRGPFARGRIIDLSEGAARRLGIIDAGVAPVTIEVLSRPHR